MKMRYFFCGLIVFMIGAGVCLYPLIQDKYTTYQQEKMVEDVRNEIFEQIMKDNENKKEDIIGNEASSENVGENNTNKNEEETLIVEVEENEEEIEYVESSSEKLKGQKIIGIVEIKKIKVVFPIVEGTEKDNLHIAIGHMVKTSGIGEKGNCVIAGHRGGKLGEFFKNLHLLSEGDVIELTDLTGYIHKYEVYDSFIVEPTRMDVTYNNDPYDRTVTLITCEDNGTKRLIIKAKYVDI